MDNLAEVPEPSESPLVAVCLPAPEAATAVKRSWELGEAVTVLDPLAPRAKVASLLEDLRPTHLVDSTGRRTWRGGRAVEADVAAVVTTSGTTAEARHVVLTRKAMQASARAVGKALDLDPEKDRWLACLPLHHVAGLAIIARSHFCDTALTVQPAFDVDSVGEVAGRCSLVSLVPTTLVRLLDAGVALGRFRRVLVGGGPVPEALIGRAADSGASVHTTYGLTEAGGGCVHDGSPLDGVTIVTAPGGEILVKGDVVMRGYHRDVVATEEVFTAEGWLRTGDLGAIGPDGLLHVLDRVKDVIVTGGVNVSPAAVERVLTQHPGVGEVCVLGVADAEWGERVVAFVVPSGAERVPTVEELRVHCSDQLSRPELPREVVRVTSLPRSPGGKVLRRALRDAHLNT
jgi:O-succinylbenzoic acid--CoA ligase